LALTDLDPEKQKVAKKEYNNEVSWFEEFCFDAFAGGLEAYPVLRITCFSFKFFVKKGWIRIGIPTRIRNTAGRYSFIYKLL